MSLRNKLAIVGLSGLMFTGAAVGLTGVASAQDGSGSPGPNAEAVEADLEYEGDSDYEGDFEDFEDFEDFQDFEDFEDFDGEWPEDEDYIDDLELSEEDEAVFERFDQCLTENGIEGLEDSFETDDELSEEQWEAIEADVDRVFESCEPILEDLSEDAMAIMEDCPDDHEDYDEAEELESSGANA